MSSAANETMANAANSTLQVRKVTKTTAEEEKALRDQLHIEIENKSKACSNTTYECSLPRLEGYEYCIRHILFDTRAPYKQCAFTYPSGKKCNQAALKHDIKKDPGLTTFCFEHSRLVQLTKTRNSVGKYKQVESNETLLNDLSHHLNVDKSRPEVLSNFTSDADEEIDVVSPNVEPFINYDHIADLDTINQTVKRKKRILDYASDSSSDDDIPNMNNTSKSHEWDNSDNESVDSHDEDLLKHAGIYTTEEATVITKQKLMKLQGLYMDQIYRLQHVLKEKRRKYLHAIRKERESLCSIHDQPKENPQERRLYEKLKALNHYHKRHGIEAVLYKKFKEKRSRATDGSTHKILNFSKCIFTEGGVKCGEKSLPCCKYCKKHILEDKKQILFRACGVEKSGIVCQEPVPHIFEDSTCVLHIKLPTPKTYTQKKFESETEEDEDESFSIVGIKKEENKDENEFGKNENEIIFKEEHIEVSEGVEMMEMGEDPNENVTISHEIDEEIAPQDENKTEIEKNETVSPRQNTSTGEAEILFEVQVSSTGSPIKSD